jgi:imidazolonepropionase
MLIHSSSQLLTLANGPQRGKALGTLGIIENGAVVVRDEKIVAVGTTAELKASYPQEPTLDASNCVLMPGFVDPHTHVIWGGDRANEFEMKMAGTAYLDILAAGGGIISTVRATRTASIESLIAQTRPRLLRMFSHGTTTVEAKTGYGLQTATELRLLKALLTLDVTCSTSSLHLLVPTIARIQGQSAGLQIWSVRQCCHAQGMVGVARPALPFWMSSAKIRLSTSNNRARS